MWRLAFFCLVVCLPAGCGGGDNRGGYVLPEYKPDFSTPEGATEAFARAIETQNIELIEQTLAPDEREGQLPMYRENFRKTEEENLAWRLEFDQARYLDDDRVIANVTYFQILDNKETPHSRHVVIFKKVEDGTWRFSPAAAKAYQEEQQPKEQPEKQPEDKPEDKPDEDSDEEQG